MSPSSEAERIEMSRVPYASAVGSLMFAMICTRPDIAHAVGVVSRYMANPGREHWMAVKRILRYIKGTLNVALCYGGSDKVICGYVDSDYAGDLDRSKSTTGYVFLLASGAVSWVSKLQSVVATSTTEAEYVAATQASKEAVWLKLVMEELKHIQETVSLFCDSQSALHLAKNPAFHARSKHIRVQYHFVREKVEEGTIAVEKINTKQNVADFLTKVVNTDKFMWCRSSCGLIKTLKIAEDVAQGLAYIHQASKLIHGNLKSSNVLLGSDFEACVTDYALYILADISLTDYPDSAGYKAPEIRKAGRRASSKSDVFAFGVLLLELLTGKTPSQHPFLAAPDVADWVRAMRDDDAEEEKWLRMLVEISSLCSLTSPEQRPTMRQALKMIQSIKESAMVENSARDSYNGYS